MWSIFSPMVHWYAERQYRPSSANFCAALPSRPARSTERSATDASTSSRRIPRRPRRCGVPQQSADLIAVTNLGWWDPDKCDVMSALLLNASLVKVRPVSEKAVVQCLREEDGAELNLERLIAEGLHRMEPHELMVTTNKSGWPIENALTFNWARSVRSVFSNVHLEFQAPMRGGYADIYANGFISPSGGTLSVLRNGTLREGSRDLDTHYYECTLGKYSGHPFALLNFATTGDEVVLPQKAVTIFRLSGAANTNSIINTCRTCP